MKCLKRSVDKLPTKDRFCNILFDEISLQAALQYDSRRDAIDGLVDLGVERQQRIADHALVFMLKGLRKKFKQPVCFMFCEGTTPTNDLAVAIKTVIRAVQNIGLTVISTVCDQGSTNQSAINLLNRENSPTATTFFVDGKEIVPVYDPPHLLKGVRNNLLTKRAHFTVGGENKVATWTHVIQFYENDTGDGDEKCVPSLTDEHIYPEQIRKMKVSFAAQVFSHRLSSTMRLFSSMGMLKDIFLKNTFYFTLLTLY